MGAEGVSSSAVNLSGKRTGFVSIWVFRSWNGCIFIQRFRLLFFHPHSSFITASETLFKRNFLMSLEETYHGRIYEFSHRNRGDDQLLFVGLRTDVSACSYRYLFHHKAWVYPAAQIRRWNESDVRRIFASRKVGRRRA